MFPLCKLENMLLFSSTEADGLGFVFVVLRLFVQFADSLKSSVVAITDEGAFRAGRLLLPSYRKLNPCQCISVMDE